MDNMEYESMSREETYDIAFKMAEEISAGAVICLDGDLGVGKTVFAQGFGAGLGIEEPMASPTFTILREYHEGRLPLYHFDVYRVSDIDEMEEIGFDDCVFSEGITIIEWAENIEDILKAVNLSYYIFGVRPILEIK